MVIKGISEGFHDASVTLIEGNEILWAKHAERFSRKKNDRKNPLHLRYADADVSVFYENVELKNERRMRHRQIPLDTKIFHECDYHTYHHESHAAGAYYTSPFTEDVVCVVIDAIGEWDCSTIWTVKNGKIKKGVEIKSSQKGMLLLLFLLLLLVLVPSFIPLFLWWSQQWQQQQQQQQHLC